MIDKTSDVNAAYDNFENFFLEVIDITIYLWKKGKPSTKQPLLWIKH
jgi:hypothetical protein